MNDPSEETYFEELRNIALKESDEAFKIYDTLFSESFMKNVVDPFGRFIASFSKNRDSLSMWNYYATGNGYNIGIDVDKLRASQDSTSIAIWQMDLLYDKDKQIDKLISTLLGFKDDCEEYLALDETIRTAEDEADYHNAYQQQVYIESKVTSKIHELKLEFKHPAYEREEEVRLILSQPDYEENTRKFKVSQTGVFIEYLPLTFDVKSCLESVMIHPLSGSLHIEGTTRFIASRYPKHKIEILPSAIPFRLV
jgi:hypothetical protein